MFCRKALRSYLILLAFQFLSNITPAFNFLFVVINYENSIKKRLACPLIFTIFYKNNFGDNLWLN